MKVKKLLQDPVWYMLIAGTMLSLTAALAWSIGTPRQTATGVCLGGLLGLFNFGMLALIVDRFMGKKSFALTFLIIVFKWSIVLGTVYMALTSRLGVSVMHFILGIVLSVPVVMAWAVLREKSARR
jgi:hypothetical protein